MVFCRYMIQDPEHVRGDPGDSDEQIFTLRVANVSPGNNAHLVRDASRHPHDGASRVPRTHALGELVRPHGTDMLVGECEVIVLERFLTNLRVNAPHG